jgi:predicted ATPase/DNA-binding CsgD family transcriptional regulator
MAPGDASVQAQRQSTTVVQSPPDQPATARQPTTPPEVARRSNLPAPITSFIGRTTEVAAVEHSLAAARLVTLIGAGGVGKTRLALRVADAALAAYSDGVWLAELGPLADPALVPNVVAAALGVREQAGVPIAQTLKQTLHPRCLLLVLDNCEHLGQACAELAEALLGACPGLQILATSREPLGIAGEVAWRVPSLSVPDSRVRPSAEQLSAYAATCLFIERATAARPDFRVTDQNAPAIIEVCRRLDGIPLALELAATRVRLLSVEQLAARLHDRFQLLAGGRRTAPPRQQTLRATLDWSYALLQEPERRLFNRLAVFAGGWTVEAAEAICAGPELEPAAVLELLGRLVDQSLVVAEEQAGRVRYWLLETMRQYAAEKLEAVGETVALRQRHRDWFLAEARRSPFELFDPLHVAWLAEELDNLRAALRWSIQRGEVEAGLRLAQATSAFWHQRGAYSEGRMWLAELLGLPGAEAATRVRARALLSAATLANLQADFSAAEALSDESLILSRRLGYGRGITGALHVRGVIAVRRGDLAQAQVLFEEGLSVSRGDGSQALEFYFLLLLGLVALEQGDQARAGALGAESLALARQIGHVRGQASSLYILGRVAASRGDDAAGRALLEESLALHREHADRDGIEVSLRGLAHLLLDQGAVAEAGHLLAESLALAQEGGDRLELARSLEGLAGVAMAIRPDHAVRLAGAAAALREALGTRAYPWERARLDRWLGAARRSLGPQAYAVAWTEGRDLPLDQVLAGALTLEGRPPAGAVRPAMVLSPRECEVARLIARGYSNRQIAEQLVIAPRTADTHVGHILTKLNLHSRAELAAWAATHGLTGARAD